MLTRIANLGIGGTNPVRIMGILNASPESFYKGSVRTSRVGIRDAAKAIEDDGADLVDVGGMSTAPYLSGTVSEKIESTRVLRAVKIIQSATNLPISVDTCRSGVASAALENGAEIINDISGLKYDPEMKRTVSKYRPSLILCAFHDKTVTGNLIFRTRQLLDESLAIAKDSGIPMRQIVLDPSIGFFRKTGRGSFFTRMASDWVKRDLSVIRNLGTIKDGFPIMVSVSNKSFIGSILKKNDPGDRLFGSIAAEVISILNGADIIRTHHVPSTKDAISITASLSR